MGILTLYGTKKLHKKNSPAYMGILTLYVVRIRELYQTKGECLRIRILESGFGIFLCGPQIPIGSVPYGTDPLLRFQLGPSHVFVRVTGI
jgi:hypothetical protein